MGDADKECMLETGFLVWDPGKQLAPLAFLKPGTFFRVRHLKPFYQEAIGGGGANLITFSPVIRALAWDLGDPGSIPLSIRGGERI